MDDVLRLLDSLEADGPQPMHAVHEQTPDAFAVSLERGWIQCGPTHWLSDYREYVEGEPPDLRTSVAITHDGKIVLAEHRLETDKADTEADTEKKSDDWPESEEVSKLCKRLKAVPIAERERGWKTKVATHLFGKAAENYLRQARRYKQLYE